MAGWMCWSTTPGSRAARRLKKPRCSDWQRQIDILLTGYFLVAREAFKVMKAQGIGGTMVFVGSKNSLAAGKGASAYSAAKAGEVHLARCLAEEGGALGIRVNSVLPDAVIQGSSIWDSQWKEARAAQYGIAVDDLNDFYRKRNTLKVEILPEDLAEAIAFLAESAQRQDDRRDADGRRGCASGVCAVKRVLSTGPMLED